MLSCKRKTFTRSGILALNAVLISKKRTTQRIKTYLKSECSSTTKSSENQFRIEITNFRPNECKYNFSNI